MVREVKDRLENFDKDDHEDAQKNLEESKWKVRSGNETKDARGSWRRTSIVDKSERSREKGSRRGT